MPERTLPEGWKEKKLGSDLAAEIQPGYACGEHNRDKEGIAHFRPMNVNTEGEISTFDTKFIPAEVALKKDLFLVKGDVLFNNTNSTELVGKTALYEGEQPVAFSNHMSRIRCDPDIIDPGFLAKALHYKWHEGFFAMKCNQHVSQSSIERGILADLDLPLPPLSEQKRIVAKLDELMAEIKAAKAHLSRAKEILKRFRQSVLNAAVTGKLTEEWRKKKLPFFRKLDGLDTTQPQGWRKARLSEVASILVGGTPSRKESAFWGGDIPWISSGEVANCRIASTRESITSLGLQKSSAKLLPKGAVVIAMIGEGKTRGQSAILDIEATTNQNVAGLVFNCEVVMPEYAWFWAQSHYEITRATGRGGAQPALNKEKVGLLEIPTPPVEEQLEITRRVKSLLARVDVLDDCCSVAEASVGRLLPEVLSKAFRGELVPREAGSQAVDHHESHGR